MIGRNKLAWKGDDLYREGSSKALASIERDSTYPDMWRVRKANGTLSDMTNRTRAKDAAESMVLSILNRQETAREGGSIRQTRRGATAPAKGSKEAA
jgi:hypothetical protein